MAAPANNGGVVVVEQQQQQPDAASIGGESAHTSSSIISKSKSLKKKLKKKFHLHGHHGANGVEEDGDGDGDEYEDDEDDEDMLENGVTPHANAAPAPGITPAQAYAEQHTGSLPTGGDPYFAAQDAQQTQAAVQSPTTAATSSAPNTPGKAASVRSKAGSTSLPPTQSDWKRRAEFHNLFEGKVGEEEHLVSDYTCAWAKDILRHGRLYVGAQHLAFICTIIGLKCSLVIPFADVTSIEKTVTARVIPNAIAITTKDGDNYTLCSFVYRDLSYDLIVDCWKSINTSAYDSFISTQTTEFQADIAEGTEKSPFPAETAAPVTEHAAHPATNCSGGHFKETVLDVRFPSEPEKIFNLLYRNDDFHKQLCASQKLTDLIIKPWGPAGKAGMEKREYQYTKPLNASVGPSTAICYITDEELVKDTDSAFEVLSITKTPDVPSGGSFSVHTKSCLTWAGGSKGGTRMVVTTECVWTGRSMIKGIVTSASIAGQRDFNKGLAKSVRKHIHAHPAEFGSGDINAPEADDELGTETTAEAAEEDVNEKNAPASGLLGLTARVVRENEMLAAILVISNLVLLIAVLVSLFRSGRGVKITKLVLAEKAEVDALARLQRLEDSWAEFRKAVDVLAVRAPHQ